MVTSTPDRAPLVRISLPSPPSVLGATRWLLCFTAFCPEDPEPELLDKIKKRFHDGKGGKEAADWEGGLFSQGLRRPCERAGTGQAPRSGARRRLGPHPHLHHQHDGVQGDHGHDGVLEGRRHHEVPHAVLEGVSVLRHVAGQGLGTDGEVDTRPLWKVTGGH